MVKIGIKRLRKDIELPKRGHENDAGMDLCWNPEYGFDTFIQPWVKKFETGIAVNIPAGYVGYLKEKSGLASKGVRVHGGVIDAGYTGEIVAILSAENSYGISPGHKICQLVIEAIPETEWEEYQVADEFPKTSRGSDGFGSTGR